MDLTNLIRTRVDKSRARLPRLHVLFGTTEVAPFAKTGGLADVSASLPKAIAGLGHRVSIVMPLYGHLDPQKMRLSRRLEPIEVPRKAKSQNKAEVVVWEGRFAPGVTVFFLECPEYFERPGMYGYNAEEFDDNAERFAFFSRALVEFVLQTSVPVDLLHLNDWHTALAPVYIAQYYKKEFADIPTMMTIHNIAFQGQFPASEFDATGLPKSYLKEGELGQGDGFNFLKGAIKYADHIVAVSPTFANEIQTKEGGAGLDELLASRSKTLSGILNGVDYSIWSPQTDRYIDVRYDSDTLNGKRRNKAQIQHMAQLPVRPSVPLFGFVGRLSEQKGLDILVPALRQELKKYEDDGEGFQVVFLGEGEEKYARQLTKLAKDFPKRVHVHIGYDEERAHRYIAGSDLMFIPSRFEPCGLVQIYAMRYGTLPVVHKTGGLADTVTDASEGAGTGFVFDEYKKGSLVKAIDRVLELYRKQRQWRPLMVHAMAQNFSWRESASSYEELYYRARGISWVRAEEKEKGKDDGDK